MKNRLKDPRPLNFYEARQLKVLPEYFESIDLSMSIYNLEDTIIKWIDNNLNGRYFVAKATALDSNNQYANIIKVGFENPKELSYFTLACPHLKYK
jgi:hypothetical protein